MGWGYLGLCKSCACTMYRHQETHARDLTVSEFQNRGQMETGMKVCWQISFQDVSGELEISG